MAILREIDDRDNFESSRGGRGNGLGGNLGSREFHYFVGTVKRRLLSGRGILRIPPFSKLPYGRGRPLPGRPSVLVSASGMLRA